MTFQELLNLNIVELFGLQNASEEDKKKFLEYAAGLVLERVVAQVVKDLPEEKREEFFTLFKEGSPEEAKAAFLKENVPHLEEIVFGEILIFKNEALRIAQEIQNPKSQAPNKHELRS